MAALCPPPINIVIADDVWGRPGAAVRRAREVFAAQRDAFLFGTIAPDVQSFAGNDARQRTFSRCSP